MEDIKILEVTKENEQRYLEQICNLEEVVLSNMQKEGKIGQLFITGMEDVHQYIQSSENSVIVAVNEEDNVIAATYITQGQSIFSYNDITKYFKVSPEYSKYVREQYSDEMSYKADVLKAYETKIQAYLYARNRILQEFPQYTSIQKFLESEIESESQFDEKSILRETLINYMSEYITSRESEGEIGISKRYEQFFWMTAEDVTKTIYGASDENRILNNNILEAEYVLQLQREHQEVFENARLKIYEQPGFEQQTYFKANPRNSIEIDTYITDPNNRSQGIAKKIVFEGIKCHIQKMQHLVDTQQLFLCSTLHRDNLSSRYVSEFFGLRDNLFVQRRHGRDREVHITKIERQGIQEYLKIIEEKLSVLYGYKNDKIRVSNERKQEIIKEQLQYEKKEFKRLNKIRHNSLNYSGNVKDMESKARKIQRLKGRLAQIRTEEINIGDER